MISKSEISTSGGAARYHDKAFNQDGTLAQSDNYYVREKASAIWQGQGAAILGIEGQSVGKEQFVAFLDGKMPHPKTGVIQDLAQNAKGANRQPGFDLTVAPPKSVSILALVAGDDRVIEAHETANKVAMQWLETHGSMVRVRHDGQTIIEHKDNLLYASVMHVTNRENEPHVHSHNVVVSAVFDQDSNKWRSLTNTEIYRLRSKADVVYKAELAAQLHDLGYALTYARNGVDFEVQGFSKEQLAAFSSRSQDIAKALEARGLDRDAASYQARQAATLDSRKQKVEFDRETLNGVWSSIADHQGLDLKAVVAQAVQHATDPRRGMEQPSQHAVSQQQKLDDPIRALLKQEQVTDQQKSGLLAVSWAIQHLAEREQSFKSTDLEVAALRFSRGRIGDIQWAVQKHVDNGLLLDRGQSEEGAKYYTTARAIHAEETLYAAIQQGKGRGNVILNHRDDFGKHVEQFNARMTRETGSHFALSDEQVRAAQHILMHPDAIQGIQGEAGTGKTAALAMVRDVAQAKGWDVMGMATSGSAAAELERSSGIKSQTIASFFADRQRAMEIARAEVEGIKTQIIQSAAAGKKGSFESRILDVQGEFTDFGKSRYVFDHAQGSVHKAPSTLSNAVGLYLLEFAGKQQQQREAGSLVTPGESPSFMSQLKTSLLAKGTRLSEHVGRSMVSLEEVGMVEAISARNALYLNRDPKIGDLKDILAKKEAELLNLERTGRKDGRRVLMVMDEASLTGAEDTARFLKQAQLIQARVVLQGDTKQHGSIPAGRAFAQAQDVGMNVATLSETRRFDRASKEVRQAVGLMQKGEFETAIGLLRRTRVQESDLVDAVQQRYIDNLQALLKKEVPDPNVAVVTLTNRDRKAINQAVSDALSKQGYIGTEAFTKQHLDQAKLTKAQQVMLIELQAAMVDTLVFNRSNKAIGVERGDVLKVVSLNIVDNLITAQRGDGTIMTFNPQVSGDFTPAILEERFFHKGDKVEARAVLYNVKRISSEDEKSEKNKKLDNLRIANGTKGVLEHLDKDGATIKWSDGSVTSVTNRQLMHVDHAYAHTTFREQGATVHREIIALSTTGAHIFNREAAYVAATRAKGVTEVVVTDEGVQKMLQNAGKNVEKTTAINWEERLDRVLTMGGGLPKAKTPGQQTEKRNERSIDVSR